MRCCSGLSFVSSSRRESNWSMSGMQLRVVHNNEAEVSEGRLRGFRDVMWLVLSKVHADAVSANPFAKRGG
jgi:hypothetical protein